MLLKKSSAHNLMVFMVDSADDISGKTGLTLTITASKDGAAFSSISPTVTERGDGWYNVALTSSHTDTAGDLALHITGAAANAYDVAHEVEAPVDLASVSGDQAAADNLETVLDGSGGTVTIETLDLATANLGVLDVEEMIVRQGGPGYMAYGTVASTTGSTTTLDAGAFATADYYLNALLVITEGTGFGQVRAISGYTAGRVATHGAWTTNPTGTSKYTIFPGSGPEQLTIVQAIAGNQE